MLFCSLYLLLSGVVPRCTVTAGEDSFHIFLDFESGMAYRIRTKMRSHYSTLLHTILGLEIHSWPGLIATFLAQVL